VVTDFPGRAYKQFPFTFPPYTTQRRSSLSLDALLESQQGNQFNAKIKLCTDRGGGGGVWPKEHGLTIPAASCQLQAGAKVTHQEMSDSERMELEMGE